MIFEALEGLKLPSRSSLECLCCTRTRCFFAAAPGISVTAVACVCSAASGWKADVGVWIGTGRLNARNGWCGAREDKMIGISF